MGRVYTARAVLFNKPVRVRNQSNPDDNLEIIMNKPATPQKSLTVSMGGFDGLIHALGRIPRDVNRALPMLERGKYAEGTEALTKALVEVELAKAAILGNLAFAAIRSGDVSACTGYVDIALESLTELGLEKTELGVMLALVHANLPADKPAEPAASDTPAPEGGEKSGG